MAQDTLDVAPSAAPAVSTRLRHTSTPEPSGCRWCGTGERQHASRFAPSVGQHLFGPPTAAQRLARMRTRRADQR